MTPRIGITLRMMRVEATGEWRDALATDWARYLRVLCAGGSWVMLPNLGEEVVAYAQSLGVTGLVLSGGDDIGATPQRDVTEMALLHHAAACGLPVLGVCRGMQMLQYFCGSTLAPVDKKLHVATRHPLTWVKPLGIRQTREMREVNSYHQHGLTQETTADPLEPLAVCNTDNTVEAVRGRNLPWLGIMWHPEREAQPYPQDMALLQHHLGFLSR